MSYVDLFMLDENKIKGIKKNDESSNFTFFKIKLFDNKEYICGPIETGSTDYKYIMRKRAKIIERNRGQNYRVIKTSKGKIVEYPSNKNKKKKALKRGKNRVVALGLVAAIGIGTVAMSKSDIDIKSALDNGLTTIFDKLDEARLDGTLTDERLHEYYTEIFYDNPNDQGARNFFEYEREKNSHKSK